jgi:hypothetical protein
LVFTTSIQVVERPPSEFLLTEDRSKRFGCPYSGCDYKSNRKNNLQRHKETMHHARAVAFNCCSTRFFRRAGEDSTRECQRGKYHCTVDLLFDGTVIQEVNFTVILPPLVFPALMNV